MPDDWSDDRLLDELDAAFREADVVPADVKRIGTELFSWRTIEADLAELASDTAFRQDDGLVLSRAPNTGAVRSVTVRASWLSIDLDIESQPPALRGRVIPRERPMPAEIVVEGPSRTAAAVPVDDFGYFVVDPFAWFGGTFRLRCADVVTPWFD